MVTLNNLGLTGAISRDLVDHHGFIDVSDHFQQPIDRKLGYLGQDRFVFFRFAPHCDGAIWNDSRSSGFGYGAWAAFEEVLPLGQQHGVEFGKTRDRCEHVLVIDRQEHRAFIADRRSAEGVVNRQRATPS